MAPSQPKCLACKQAAAKSDHLCPGCLVRAYCSAACLDAAKRPHRKECARLAFATFNQALADGLEDRCNALVNAGQHEEAEREYARLLRVGEVGLLHRGEAVEVRKEGMMMDEPALCGATPQFIASNPKIKTQNRSTTTPHTRTAHHAPRDGRGIHHAGRLPRQPPPAAVRGERGPADARAGHSGALLRQGGALLRPAGGAPFSELYPTLPRHHLLGDGAARGGGARPSRCDRRLPQGVARLRAAREDGGLLGRGRGAAARGARFFGHRARGAGEGRGEAAAHRRLIVETLRPLAARELLGAAATDAAVASFDFDAALAVPLPDPASVELLLKWNSYQQEDGPGAPEEARRM